MLLCPVEVISSLVSAIPLHAAHANLVDCKQWLWYLNSGVLLIWKMIIFPGNAHPIALIRATNKIIYDAFVYLHIAVIQNFLNTLQYRNKADMWPYIYRSFLWIQKMIILLSCTSWTPDNFISWKYSITLIPTLLARHDGAVVICTAGYILLPLASMYMSRRVTSHRWCLLLIFYLPTSRLSLPFVKWIQVPPPSLSRFYIKYVF